MNAALSNYLKKQSISRKILLIFAPPLCLLLIGISMLLLNKIGDIGEAKRAKQTVDLAMILDGVAHNHAVERGLTAGFLGSKGQIGAEPLSKQRQKADAAASRFKQYFAQAPASLPPYVKKALSSLDKQLGLVPTLRQQVDQLDASGNPFAVYSNINKTALDTIALLSLQITDSEVKLQIDQLLHLLWLKERSGQERGALNGVFASGQFNIAKVISINSFVTDQNNHMEALSRGMNARDFQQLNNVIADENNEQVLRYRETFFGAVQNNSELNEDSPTWFKFATARIKNIKSVSDRVSEQVIDKAESTISSAWAMLVATLVLALATATALTFFSLYVSKSLRYNIGLLINGLNSIKAHKDFSHRIELDTEDELADAAKATNDLLAELQRAIGNVTGVMSEVAAGKFESRIREHFEGDLNTLKNGVNETAEKVEITMNALSDVMDALDRGDFSARMRTDVEGELKQKVDRSMKSLDAALSSVGNIFSSMSEGQFSQRISIPLNGALDKLKQNVNRSLDNIESALSEISDAVTHQKEGHFSWRIQGSYDGELAALKDTINDSMGSIDSALNEVASVFRHIRNGDYSRTIQRDMRGDLDEMKSLINVSVQELDTAISEISSVANAQRKGDLSKLISGDYSGQLHALKGSLNSSSETMSSTVNAITEVMQHVAHGDFSKRIDLPMLGVFNELKTAINDSVASLQAAIEDLNDVAGAQKDGQLHYRMNGNHAGELEAIQTAINASMGNLCDVLENVQQSSHHALAMTGEQTTAINDMSRRTESQAAALEEVSSTMEQIANSASDTERGCKDISEHVEQALGVCETSLEVVESTVKSMQDMRESSQRIASITAMIDEIAFQTNLLALNAAVEAARAGDQGRGFAVVATEVRSLAQRSSDAARSIKELIDENVIKVDGSFALAQQSKSGLEHISEAIQGSSRITKEVSESAITQNISVKEVKQAISELDSMTQENAAMVEQTTAATRSVEDQSAKVNSMLKFFVTKATS